MKKWMDMEGEIFLKDIGMKGNQSILDFGCGLDKYTILAAVVVGRMGQVYVRNCIGHKKEEIK